MRLDTSHCVKVLYLNNALNAPLAIFELSEYIIRNLLLMQMHLLFL